MAWWQWLLVWYSALEAVWIMTVLYVLAEALRMLIFHARDDAEPRWGLAVLAAMIVLCVNTAWMAFGIPWPTPDVNPEILVYISIPIAFLSWMVFITSIEMVTDTKKR